MPTANVNIPSQTLQQVVTANRKISSIIFAESPDGNKLFAVSNDDAQLAATDGATKVTSVIVSPDDIQINVTAGASTSSLHINPSDINFTADSLTLNGDEIATENYVASAVAGLLDYRGVYDASVNAYPSSGGSGSAGAIVKSDFWIISVAGTLPTGLIVEAGDMVIAKVDTPGNTQANWNIIQYNIGYTPENAANKVSTITASATQYPNNNAVIAYAQPLNAPASAKFLGRNFTLSSGTNTTSEELLMSYQVLGSQISVDDYLEFYMLCAWNSSAGTKLFKIYFSPTNSLADASKAQVAQMQFTTSSNSPIPRRFIVKYDTLIRSHVPATNNLSIIDTLLGGTNVPTDISVPSLSAGFWILISCTKSVGTDTDTAEYSYLMKRSL